MAIFAMGGYVTGMLGLYLHWSLWAAMPVGAVAAVIFSVIIGVACLRLGGAYVALLTFAISEAMYLLIITDTECFFMEDVTCRNFTGGTRGLVNFGNFGLQQLLGYKYAAFGNYFLALALLALATAFSVFVIRSPVGMAFAALRDNTTYAIARGISRFKYQLLVFAASALFTGLAGAVYAGYFSVMGADMLNLTLLLLLLSMMVVGGLGRVWGPIAGAATLTLVNEGLNEFVDWRLLGLGLILSSLLFSGRPESSARSRPRSRGSVRSALHRSRDGHSDRARHRRPALRRAEGNGGDRCARAGPAN